MWYLHLPKLLIQQQTTANVLSDLPRQEVKAVDVCDTIIKCMVDNLNHKILLKESRYLCKKQLKLSSYVVIHDCENK